MVENNLDIKEELFKNFPELNDWFRAFIPLERFDEYIYYDYVNIKGKNNTDKIRCGITIFTARWVFSFNFVRPDNTDKDGWIIPNIAQISDKYLNFDQFDEGAYDKESFEDIMTKIINFEGILLRRLFVENLVKIDLVNLDHLIEQISYFS